MSKDKRFEKVYTQDLGCTMILRDRETGVNYLYVSGGSGGGVTPLLDAQGNVVITSVHRTPKGPEF